MNVHRRCEATPACNVGVAFIAYNAIGEARQPMTDKKGFHSSTRTDKTPAATGFWAAVTAIEVT
jgi:hypothetical protein